MRAGRNERSGAEPNRAGPGRAAPPGVAARHRRGSAVVPRGCAEPLPVPAHGLLCPAAAAAPLAPRPPRPLRARGAVVRGAALPGEDARRAARPSEPSASTGLVRVRLRDVASRPGSEFPGARPRPSRSAMSPGPATALRPVAAGKGGPGRAEEGARGPSRRQGAAGGGQSPGTGGPRGGGRCAAGCGGDACGTGGARLEGGYWY